jgi:hypothetical protein
MIVALQEKGSSHYERLLTPVFPLVSVILPVRNPDLRLLRCIESIKTQTYRSIELVLRARS